MSQTQNENMLTFQGITKTFPGVVALNDVSFSIAKGEVHGLVGENGAGKSTLIKVLCGVYTADEGRILIDGQPVSITSALDAGHCGIQVMHQEISVLTNMTVAENMFLYDMPRKGKIFANEREMNRRARQILDEIGMEGVQPAQKVSELSLAAQQMVNLARIVSTRPKVVLLDEPTASLTMNEVKRLFQVINQFKRSGVSIIYISHYLEEVLDICDRVTVLRDGRYIETVNAKETTKERVVSAMLGKQLKRGRRTPEEAGEVALQMDNVTALEGVRHVSLAVREREVLGLYGLNGAGKTETLRAIMGLNRLFEGNITCYGQPIHGQSLPHIIRQGVIYVPEDRRRQGLVLSMDVAQNSTLGNEEKYARHHLMDFGAERSDALKHTRAMKVKTPSLETKVASLSGGNQQKVIMARCISRSARVYLLDEPTVGIDVGAREEIYALISDIVRQGASVVLASSDMTEILENCDRIAVIAHGTIVKVLDGRDATEEKLLLYAMGE